MKNYLGYYVGIKVHGNNNKISQVKMENMGNFSVRVQGDSNELSNLDFIDVGVGIAIDNGTLNRVDQCDIQGINDELGASAIMLSGNGFTQIIDNNLDGVCIIMGVGTYANITGNTIINCAPAGGIFMGGSNINNVISNNVINYNGWGIQIPSSSNNNTITNNDLRWNEEGGLFIAPGSTGNTVFGNQE